jgi:hypothetical protein
MSAAASIWQRDLGSSTAEAWAGLKQVAGELARDMALRTYLERSIHDPSWLAQSGGAPLPRGHTRPTGADRQLGEAIDRIADDLLARDQFRKGFERIGIAVEALRFADFVVRAGLSRRPAAALETRVDRCGALLRSLVIPLLNSPSASEVIARVGRLDESIMRLYVRPLLDEAIMGRPLQRQEPIGTRIGPEVLEWVFPHGASVVPLEHMASLAADVSTVAAEYAILTVTKRPHDHQYREQLPLALWSVLDAQSIAPNVTQQRLLSVMVQGARLGSGDLLALDGRFPQVLPVEAFWRALTSEPWNADVERLAKHIVVTARRGPSRAVTNSYFDPVVPLARLRWYATRSVLNPVDATMNRDQAALIVELIPRVSLSIVSPFIINEVASNVVVAITITALCANQKPMPGVRRPMPPNGSTVVAPLVTGSAAARLYGLTPPGEQGHTPSSYWEAGTRGPAPSDSLWRASAPASERQGSLTAESWMRVSEYAKHADHVVVSARLVDALNARTFGEAVVLEAAVLAASDPDSPFTYWDVPKDLRSLQTHLRLRTPEGPQSPAELLLAAQLRSHRFQTDLEMFEEAVLHRASAESLRSWTSGQESTGHRKWVRTRWRALSGDDANAGNRSKVFRKRGQQT